MNKEELWDYYQVLIKSKGFNGITELLSENTRLHAVIDEARAQEPVGRIRKVAHGGPHCFQVYENLPIGDSKVYISPIPAQQSPAVAVQEVINRVASFVETQEPINIENKILGSAIRAAFKFSDYFDDLKSSPHITEHPAR